MPASGDEGGPMAEAAVARDDGPVSDGRASVKEGFAFASASFVVNAVVGMLSALLTARVYGVEVIGQYALVTAPWLMLIQFSSVSEQVALTRRVALLPARHPMVAGLFVPVLGFSSILTIVAGIPVMLFSAAALHGPIDQPTLVVPALVVIAGYAVVDNTSWNIDALLSAFRAGRELFYARLSFVASFLAFCLLFAQIDKTVWSMTEATVAAFVFSLAVRLVLIRRFTRIVPDRESFRAGMAELPAMLRFSLRLVGGRIAFGINSQADTWILGSVTSVATVGAYNRAYGIAVRLSDAGYRVNEILFPSLVQHSEKGDSDSYERLLVNTLRLTALPIALVVGAAGGATFGFLELFGPGFEAGAGALTFLLLATGLTVIGAIFGQALIAVGRPHWSTSLAVLRLVVSVPLMWVLAHEWGATGVGGAVLAGAIAVLLAGTWMLRRVILSPAATRSLARTAGVAILVYGAAFGTSRLLDLALEGPVGAVAAMVAGGIVGLPVLALLPGGLDASERAAMLRRRSWRQATPVPPSKSEERAERGSERAAFGKNPRAPEPPTVETTTGDVRR
jgi:O-antigen/teichoic acid export membrane protein